MSQQKHISWLQEQLPEWQALGLIDAASAERLSSHYKDVKIAPAYNWGLLIAGVLGAILVGGGIILIFAHNWESFSISTRTFLSFLPLVIAQIIYGYAFFKAPNNNAWVESSAVFLQLMLAASIALISQTYHLEGDMASFLLSWMILSIPLMYLMRSTLVLLIYLVGILSWLVNMYDYSTAWYWLLFAAALPAIIANFRAGEPKVRANLTAWVGLICFAVSYFNVMRANDPIHVLLIPAIFLSGCYFFGEIWRPEAQRLVDRPFRNFTSVCLFIMMIVLSAEWPKKRYMDQMEWNWANDWIGIVILLGLGYGIFQLRKRWKTEYLFVLLLPIVVLLGILMVQADLRPLAIVAANLYLLAFGIFYIVKGVQLHSMRWVNLGMFFVSALIIARFFDIDLSFVLKGVAFVVLGLGFLGVNWWLGRRERSFNSPTSK